MGDDDVDDVGDDVLSCPGSYYCFSPTLLPTRRELKLNCSRSHQSSVLERSYSGIRALFLNKTISFNVLMCRNKDVLAIMPPFAPPGWRRVQGY